MILMLTFKNEIKLYRDDECIMSKRCYANVRTVYSHCGRRTNTHSHDEYIVDKIVFHF